MNKRRKLTGYEINRLIKYGMYPLDEAAYGDMPVEYIVGYAEFMEREFEVNEHTLIPRIETEELVELVVNQALKLRRNNNGLVISDVGSGSGCVGISVWLESRIRHLHTQVVCSDISFQALQVAKKNIQRLVPTEGQSQIKTIQSDLLLDYPPSIIPDIIVANLPYLPDEAIRKLDTSVRNFEPWSALKGGKDGLVLVRRLLEQALQQVSLPKAIFLEVDDFVQMDDLPNITGYEKKIKPDSWDKNRFVSYIHN